MKRLFLLLIIVATTIFMSSCNREDIENSQNDKNNIVNFDEAKEVAIQHFSKQHRSNANLRNGGLGESITFNGVDNLPGLHIFKYENGDEKSFVIISGDNRVTPVLAYGNNDFPLEDVPFGVADWMNTQITMIDDIRASEFTQEPYIHDLWDALILPDEEECCEDCPNYPECEIDSRIGCGGDSDYFCHGITPDNDCGNTTYYEYGPLLDTEWGQGCVYNELCPEEGIVQVTWGLGFVQEYECGGDLPCGHFRTGCVATAMAQVINYFEHPSSYDYASLKSIYYPWDFGEPSANEVAQLMIDAAESVNMHFQCDESGAFTSRVDNALENDFDYTYGGDYMEYHASQDVKQNIRWKKPVIFDACREDHVFIINWWYSGCHAWVCDGYKEYRNECYSTLYYNMNWGWNGTSDASGVPFNGWYLSNSWTPGTRNYQYDKNVLLNIKP